MAAKALWHHLRDSFFHYVMHHVWVFIGGAALSILAAVWAVMKHSSPLFGVAVGVASALLVVIAAAVGSHVLEERRQETPAMRRRRKEIGRYTDAGLSWEPTDRTFVNDRAEVTLLIRPTQSGSELPQPLELLIACSGIEEVLDVRHHPSGGGEFHIFPHDNTKLIVRLDAPRLYGDGFVAIRLKSKSHLNFPSVKHNTKPLRPI